MKQTLFALVILYSTFVNAQQFLNPEPIASKYLNEDRPYLVCLPPSYSDSTYSPAKYPVVLLLDGHYHYWYSMSTINFLSRNNIIPECIIVSVINTDRTRDLTPSHSTTYLDGTEREDFFKTSGGGTNFLKFINEELIPTIDENYNTMDLKVFVGHSFGGLTAVQSLLTNTPSFKAYISMDPALWWDGALCLKQLDSVKTLANTKSWFMSAANNNNELKTGAAKIRKHQEWFNKRLLEKPDTIRTKFQIYEDENHQSVTLKSLYDGMRFTFNSYKITIAIREDIDLFKNHFTMLSKEWGVDYKPSEFIINENGKRLLRQDEPKPNIALSFFKLNIELYPKSYNVYNSIANYYKTTGDKSLAIKNYNKSLELNPNNQNAKEMLKELNNLEIVK